MELIGTIHPTPPRSFTLREPSVREETGYDPQPVGTLCITETYLSLAGNWRPILWSLRPQRRQYAHQPSYIASHNTSTEEHNTNLIVSNSPTYFLLHRSKYYLQNTVLRNPQMYVIPSTMDSKVHVFNMWVHGQQTSGAAVLHLALTHTWLACITMLSTRQLRKRKRRITLLSSH